MNKSTAIELYHKAQEVATMYSNPNRDHNYNNESFEISEIIPHSDHTATVVFVKSSKKKGVAFFYFIPAKNQWRYWFPTDSHIAGMDKFKSIKEQIERENFAHNFNNESYGLAKPNFLKNE